MEKQGTPGRGGDKVPISVDKTANVSSCNFYPSDFLFKILLYIYVCVCVCARAHVRINHGAHVKVKGQLVRVSPLLPLGWFQGLDSS